MRDYHPLCSHLLIAVVLCYITGIVLSQNPITWPITPFSLPLIAIAFFIFSFLKKEKTSLCLVLVFFILLGVVAGDAGFLPPDDPQHVANLAKHKQETIVLGQVQRIYDVDKELTRLDVESHSIRTENSVYQPTWGPIRYTIKADLPPLLLPGNMVAVRSQLTPPKRFLTPGSFDYPTHLGRQNIWTTGFIQSPLFLAKIDTQNSFADQVRFATEIYRERIKKFLDANLTGDSAALYKALITGDRTSLRPELLEQFKGAGCMHILAISGIHMSLLGLFLFTVFYWLLRRSERLIYAINTKKAAALLCIIPLVLYALVGGGNTPVVRSLLMSIIVIVAVCSNRRHSFFTLTACAALLILAFAPKDIFSPSFQLTFAAVLAIGATAPILSKIHTACNERAKSGKALWYTSLAWVVTAIGVSFSATLATAPLVIFYFNRVSLVGPLANLVVEPLICLWSLTIGFTATIFIFVFPNVAILLYKIGAIGLLLATKCVFFFNALPLASLRLATPSISHIIVYYICLILLFNVSFFTKRMRLFFLVAFTLSLSLFIISPTELSKRMRDDATVAILDVGQGSAVFVEFPEGKRFLIDGGAMSSPQFNIGERVIAPYLWHRGITKIDEVISTHPDSDHYNGLPFILKYFGVEKLWVNGMEETDPSWQDLLATAREKNISIEIPQSATTISCSAGACLEVLANTVLKNTQRFSRKKNEESLILKVNHGNFSAIFPGDITSNIEEKLVDEGTDFSAELLLAAHHGSATSNSEIFLAAIAPKYLAVSAGGSRSRSFPAPQLAEKCRKHGVNMLQTAKSGTITVTSTGDSYRLQTFVVDEQYPTDRSSTASYLSKIRGWFSQIL